MNSVKEQAKYVIQQIENDTLHHDVPLENLQQVVNNHDKKNCLFKYITSLALKSKTGNTYVSETDIDQLREESIILIEQRLGEDQFQYTQYQNGPRRSLRNVMKRTSTENNQIDYDEYKENNKWFPHYQPTQGERVYKQLFVGLSYVASNQLSQSHDILPAIIRPLYDDTVRQSNSSIIAFRNDVKELLDCKRRIRTVICPKHTSGGLRDQFAIRFLAGLDRSGLLQQSSSKLISLQQSIDEMLSDSTKNQQRFLLMKLDPNAPTSIIKSPVHETEIRDDSNHLIIHIKKTEPGSKKPWKPIKFGVEVYVPRQYFKTSSVRDQNLFFHIADALREVLTKLTTCRKYKDGNKWVLGGARNLADTFEVQYIEHQRWNVKGLEFVRYKLAILNADLDTEYPIFKKSLQHQDCQNDDE
eukprot:251765_1